MSSSWAIRPRTSASCAGREAYGGRSPSCGRPRADPTSETTSSGDRDADQLDEVDPRLRRLAGQDVRDPGLAEPAGPEDRGQPPGADEGPQPGQVGVAAQQLVGVEAHAAADRLVGRQQLAVDPLERGIGVDPQPVGQVAAVGRRSGPGPAPPRPQRTRCAAAPRRPRRRRARAACTSRSTSRASASWPDRLRASP